MKMIMILKNTETASPTFVNKTKVGHISGSEISEISDVIILSDT